MKKIRKKDEIFLLKNEIIFLFIFSFKNKIVS